METAGPPGEAREQNGKRTALRKAMGKALGRDLGAALAKAARGMRGKTGRGEANKGDEGNGRESPPGSWAEFFETLIAGQTRPCRKGICRWSTESACKPEIHMSVIHPLIRDIAQETVNRKPKGRPDEPGKTQSIEYVFPDGSSLVRHSDTSALDPVSLGCGYMGEPYPDRTVIGIFGAEWYGKSESREAGRTGDRP